MAHFNLRISSLLTGIPVAIGNINLFALSRSREDALLLDPYAWYAYVNWFFNCFIDLCVDHIALILLFLLSITASLIECPFCSDIKLHRILLVDQGLQLWLQ